jgi:hypothetical protein
MAFGWSGATPTEDPDTADYELGVEMRANVDVTLTKVRVYGTPSAGTQVSRLGKVWDPVTGLVLGTATLPDNLPAGWNSFDLATPVPRTSGQRWIVSYATGGHYGFVPAALDNDVAALDGAVTFLSNLNSTAGNGRINTTPGSYPATATPGTYWSVDVEYDVGIGGNTRPVITGLTLSAADLAVTATVTATDAETLTGASYTFDWQDGSTSTGMVATASHTYATPGLKALLITVTDAGGLADSIAGAIQILAAPEAPTDLIGPLLEAALDCADLAIEPRAGRAALYPGAEVAWDDCCDGQVYARLISMTPSGSPATGARVVSPCGVLIWAVTIGVGVIRCAAVVDDQDRGHRASPRG